MHRLVEWKRRFPASHRTTRRRVGGTGLAVALIGGLTAAGAGAAPADTESTDTEWADTESTVTTDTTAEQQDSALAPVDPEDWVHQEHTTWDDYEPVPGIPEGRVDGSI